LGEVMVEMLDKLGWGVGLAEAKHAVSVWERVYPEGRAIIFIPPEQRQLLAAPSSMGVSESG